MAENIYEFAPLEEVTSRGSSCVAAVERVIPQATAPPRIEAIGAAGVATGARPVGVLWSVLLEDCARNSIPSWRRNMNERVALANENERYVTEPVS
jgi:hypothetical protein